MGKNASLVETIRAQIVILHNKEFSQRKICKKVFCSKMAVHQAITRFSNFGVYHDKKRSGRLSKASLFDNNLIWQIAVWSPISFCRKICTVLLLKGTYVHRTTVSRHLVHDFMFKPAEIPCLTPVMKVKKLAFAKQNEDWYEARWSKALFLKESAILQFAQKKRTVCMPDLNDLMIAIDKLQ